MNNNVTAAETAQATIDLLDKMPREAVLYLVEWMGELFNGLRPSLVDYIDYYTPEDYSNLAELADDYGYDDAEEFTENYTVVQDAAFPGFIVIE